MKSYEEIIKELDAKIPREVVSLRDGGGGKKLSYLEGWYVIDRLNKIFGPLGWSKEVTELRLLEGTPKPAYIAKVVLSVKGHFKSVDSEYGRWILKEGYGYGSDKGSNNPHELAVKEAITDALKVAAKDLGMSMGLALYDKTQENVEEEESPTPKKGDITPKVGAPPVVAKAPEPDLRALALSTAKVAVAKKRTSREELVSKLNTEFSLSESSIEDALKKLTTEQVATVLAKLKEMVK